MDIQQEAPSETSSEAILAFAKAGVLFGHLKSKTHPRMRPFISGVKNEIVLLDPEAITDGIQKASDFLKEKIRIGGLVLLVGTTAPARKAVESLGIKFQLPFVVTRWLGGTLTNFKVMSARLKHYETLKQKRDSGELAKYTKKEQLGFGQEIMKLSRMFDGLAHLTRLPDVLFVVDSSAHITAIREARKLHIPVVSILDNDDDPDLVTLPIVANDHARSSIEWVLGELGRAIEDGRHAHAATLKVQS